MLISVLRMFLKLSMLPPWGVLEERGGGGGGGGGGGDNRIVVKQAVEFPQVQAIYIIICLHTAL